jgi:hypothetical protein
MSQVVQEFAKVLECERTFVLSADVDALAAIQEEKRALLNKLLESDVPESESAMLKEQALANVQLIRHLVACLAGLVTPDSATYTAGGGRASGAAGRSWGRL